MNEDPVTNVLQITKAVRPDGTPSLGEAVPKSLLKSAPGIDELLGELYSILSTLPTESPPGCEDIYRLDTSIAFQAGELLWMNGGPSGCGTGHSAVQPTAEEKSRFKRAVEIVEKLVDEAS